jgi:hypothetical protein
VSITSVIRAATISVRVVAALSNKVPAYGPLSAAFARKQLFFGRAARAERNYHNEGVIAAKNTLLRGLDIKIKAIIRSRRAAGV